MTGTGESRHRWPARAMLGDYLRAGAGLAITFPPLLFVEWTASVVIVLGGLSALFAWLALRTVLRQRATVVMTDAAIARDRREISWPALDGVRLRRFGGRRKGSGYMEMEISGGTSRIKVDSEISDFLAIARRVHDAARRNGIAMDARTAANFQALDIRV